eukprot:Nk52_evm103s914 gene=Nk52_evmTU103s914
MSRASLKFYFDSASQPARSALMFIKANNIPVTECLTNIAKGETKAPEFLKVNPFGKVPAIVDNGFRLTESVAIMKYLAAKHKVPAHWYHSEDIHRVAKIDEYTHWHHTHLRVGAAFTFQRRYLLPVVFKKQIPAERVEKAEKLFHEANTLFNDVFLSKDKKFIVDNEISIADLLAVTEYTQFRILGRDFKEYPNIDKWIANVESSIPCFEECHAIINMVAKKNQHRIQTQSAQ